MFRSNRDVSKDISTTIGVRLTASELQELGPLIAESGGKASTMLRKFALQAVADRYEALAAKMQSRVEKFNRPAKSVDSEVA